MLNALFTSRNTQIAFLLLLLAGLAGVMLWTPLPVEQARQYTFDTYNRLLPRPPGNNVTIVGLDQESVKHLGTWPVGRDVMGDAVAALKDMGARSVTFDMTYTYSDVSGSASNTKLTREEPTANDLYFADKMAAAGNAVLGFSPVLQQRGAPPPFLSNVAYHGGRAKDLNQHFFANRHFMSSFPVLAKAAAGSGHVIYIPQHDSVIRLFPLMLGGLGDDGLSAGIHPSLILEAIRVALGPDTPYGVTGDPRGGIDSLHVGPYTIPTDKKGVMRVYYARPGTGRGYVPLWKVLEKQADPALIRDKLILIGGTSGNMGDVKYSPFRERIFGVEAHAEAIDQIMEGQFLHRPPALPYGEIAAAAAFSVLVIFLAQRINALLLALAVAGVSALSALAGAAAFRYGGWLADPLVPCAATGIVFVFASILSALRISIVSHEKSRFLALMSHEIRTPMTGIMGMIEFMKDDSLTREEQAEYVNTISDCSKTLLNTLNDILDVSKLEEGKLEISPVNFDLHELLNNSAEVLGRMARDKGLDLSVDIGPDVPRIMHGDPHRIRQCAMNFMNNAIKFTSKGGVTVRCARKEGNPPQVRVEVRDTGIGISEANMKKLFRGFSQADSSIARRYGGTGLGLSIAKDLVTLMGGRVGVESKLGEGSTFWFELPYRPPVETQDDGAEDDVQEPPLRILLAEDNKVNQQIAKRLLTNRGHAVAIADDGVSVVAMAQEQEFDMILMDMNMPVRSGIDATREIRALGGRHKDTPIIALTANVVDEYVQKCYKAGMNAHVAKPFSPRELYRTIARFAPEGKTASARAAALPAAETEGLTENLKEICRQLGPAYLREYIGKTLEETARLLGEARRAHGDGDMEALERAVHDLKNASGMIGLGETHRLSALVEALCRNGEPTALPEIMKILLRDADREIRRMTR